MNNLYFSFIIPVYNRPEEINELLQTFIKLEGSHIFEIVIVEDGSDLPSEQIINKYRDQLDIAYFYKKNSGPGDSRNFGMKHAKGNYFIILDSDCLLPSNYLEIVSSYLNKNFIDCYGGPDAAHESFTGLQKAISFAMTSFITTGGIRGGKEKKFQPRSFNMGISKKAFEACGGFGNIHPGEDPDLSIRLNKLGFETKLIPRAFVYHKRRISWKKFYQQVYKFGLVRPILNQWHPESKRIIYWLPSLFSLGFIISIICMALQFYLPIAIYGIYFLLAFILAVVSVKNIYIGLQAVVAIFIQFFGYGYGFLKMIIHLKLLLNKPEEQFPKLFFKNA